MPKGTARPKNRRRTAVPAIPPLPKGRGAVSTAAIKPPKRRQAAMPALLALMLGVEAEERPSGGAP